MNRVGINPRVVLALACCGLLALLVTACGSSSSSGGEAGGGATSLACSSQPNSTASGSPINFGAIITNVPGIDFAPETEAIEAYFSCLNTHGGIGGRPVKLIVEEEQINPQQAASAATKLLDNDHVVGMVGNMSLVDCSVNGKTYEEEGIFIIGLGVDTTCYEIPNYASTSLGPTGSAQLSAQYLVEEKNVENNMVGVNTLIAGGGVFNSGVLAVGKKAGLKTSSILEPLPLTDPSSTALKVLEAAGEGGAATLGWPAGEVLKVMQVLEQQGATEKVNWGCVAICNDANLVETIGPSWNKNLAVPSEYPLLNADLPEMKLFRGLMAKYKPSTKPTAYSESGFTAVRLLVKAIENLPESQLNRKGINEAIVGIKDSKLEMLCEPWSFGAAPVHFPVTAGWIFTPENGKFVEEHECMKLEPLTGQLKEAEKYASEEGV